MGPSVAKRRSLNAPLDPETDGTGPPATTSEARRRERKRQRTAAEAGNPRARARTNPWRRILLIGIPAAIVIAVVLLLLFNPLQPPCVAPGAIPASSGLPAFPAHNATSFGTSWCPPPSTWTPVLESYPSLTIAIGTSYVGLPSSIGRNSSYSLDGRAYSCTLPIATYPPSEGGFTASTIYIVSPWPYRYTLGDFFEVWAQSYASVDVNASYAAQPINYTTTSLLGFSDDSTHSVTLWVDNQVSRSGPGLDLDTLSSQTTYPSCLGSIYGTSHTILLSYASTSAAATSVSAAPTLATGGGVPDLALGLYNSPAPHLEPFELEWGQLEFVHSKALGWLALRGGP